MSNKILFIALIAFVALNSVEARRTRKTKRTKSEEESTPQPNVVTYSTFGFNDVGNYDGFVPSSPDYANYMNNYSPDSSTRLYAPAFPTAQDVSGFNGQPQDGQSYNMAEDNVPQASTLQFPHSSVSFYSQSSYDPDLQTQSQNFAPEQVQYAHNAGETNNPTYGAKLSSRNRSKFNFSDYSVLNNASPNNSEGKYSTSFEIKTTHETKPQQSLGEQNKNYQNDFKYPPTFAPSASENYKTTQMNFPKVVDFTQFKQYYPTELDMKYSTVTANPTNPFHSVSNSQSENSYGNSNFEDLDVKLTTSIPRFRDPFKKDAETNNEKEKLKHISGSDSEYSQNYFGYQNKHPLKDSKSNFEYKDKFKYNPWAFVNYTNDFKNWKNPVKGYQYATNYSNMNFEFDFSGSKNSPSENEEHGPKRPLKEINEEIIPASSNFVDLASYKFPETDFSFKKIPGYKGEEYNDLLEALKPQGYKYDPVEYVRNIYSGNIPKITTQWGNVYKTSEYSPYSKQRGKKPVFGEELNDEVVHIPRRPYGVKYSSPKYQESKLNNYGSLYTRPHRSKKPQFEWSDYATKYKSEEDLLGLRTHDTSDPAYLPTYRPFYNDLASDYDYKKLVDRWRQSYIKAKYKNAGIHDFEGYASEQKPIHVPIPNPYPIEVPHPVIVPVPQPYPVKVPIPKPVAVPVIHELTVPVEKPVPYPVVKKVPYPVEKAVPVPIEKEVPVPVVKPYPVPVPHIRPVFHHSRPREEDPIDEDDEYFPRPESNKKVPYAKRPRGSRTRSRRPSRVTLYTDRNRRRWPPRRPDSSYRPESSHRQESMRKYPSPSLSRLPADFHTQPFRHDEDEFDHDQKEYIIYCKRRGNC